jgi:hypothetical protein
MAGAEEASSAAASAAVPDPLELHEQAMIKIYEWAQYANGFKFRNELRKQYVSNEDFSRMVPGLKRMMVIGTTGAGKSTLGNKLAGFRYEWVEAENKHEWTCDRQDLLFLCKAGAKSVTLDTSYANMNYLGDAARKFIYIDTPGHNDTGDDGLLAQQATDMHVKLKNMDCINAILVLVSEPSGRFAPATQELLAKLETMFSQANRDVWRHVIIGFSRCDPADRGWRTDLQVKIEELQAEVRRRFPNCQVNIPVIPLSGADEPGQDISQEHNFERLWDFLQKSPDLLTANLQEFEGLNMKLRRVVKERDALQRLNDMRKNFLPVACNVILGLMCLYMRPDFLNLSGMIDELFITACGVYSMGPVKMYDFLVVSWGDHLLPWLDCMCGARLLNHGLDLSRLKPVTVAEGDSTSSAASKRPGAAGVAEGSAKRRRTAEQEVLTGL